MTLKLSPGNPAAERAVPVEASLLYAVLLLTPVLIATTGIGFLTNWWLFWTVPALLTMAVWGVLMTKTWPLLRGRAVPGPEERLADHSGSGVKTTELAAAKARDTTTAAIKNRTAQKDKDENTVTGGTSSGPDSMTA